MWWCLVCCGAVIRAVCWSWHLIASGDQHLHSLCGNYLGVRIVTPAEATGLLEAL
jgi:hypothetical protein